MRNELPAILFGGPPHSGKSTLIYKLSHQLRRWGLTHGVLRACPDGQSDGYNAGDDNLVQLLSHKGPWTETFVSRVVAAIQGRQVPLLVDAGGQPKRWQLPILQACTHAVLLIASPPTRTTTGRSTSFENEVAYWQGLCRQCQVPVVATLASMLEGAGQGLPFPSPINGALIGLSWGKPVAGPDFARLAQLVRSLLAGNQLAFPADHLDEAQPSQRLNLPALARERGDPAGRWRPDWLPALLAHVDLQTPVAAYGPAPAWLLAALALHIEPQPLAIFDKQLGWVNPPDLVQTSSPQTTIWLEQKRLWSAASVMLDGVRLVTFNRHAQYLDIYAPAQYPLPKVPAGPLILSGNLPQWLAVAVARHLGRDSRPWLAMHQPALGKAIVVKSQVSNHQPGDLVPIPAQIFSEPVASVVASD